MQQPKELWRDFPLDPTPTPTPTATPAQRGSDAPEQDATAQPTTAAAATATPSPSPTPSSPDDVEDGRIELPGGATITFPAANGTERAVTSAQPAPVPVAQTTQAASDDPVSLSGQAGLYVVVVAVLVVLMARWLLNHTWRAAVTVAVLLIGMGMVGLILVRWATDLGIVN